MIDLGLGKAFTGIFKERRWGVKLGIITVISYISIVLSLVMSLFEGGTTVNNLRSFTTIESTSYLLLAIVAFFVAIVLIAFSLWYNYENTQAAIQNRATKLMWEYSFGDSVKRVFKYGLASLIYGVISFLISLVIIGIPTFITILLVGGTYSQLTATRDSGVLVGIIFIILCGVFMVVLLALMAFVYALTTPGYLRLVASNTFSEAFHLRSNLRIGRKYFGYFLLAIVVLLVLSIILAFVSGMFGIVATAIGLNHPILGVGIQLVIQIPLTIVTTYLSYFVFPAMLGNIYRGIINKEDELKFLRK